MAVTPRLLSGSSNGRGIRILTTAASGTLIHTAQSATGITVFDEVNLWAYNTATGSKVLTVVFGSATDAVNLLKFTVPSRDGAYPIVPGWRLNGGAAVRAGAATVDTVYIVGYVNRVTTG